MNHFRILTSLPVKAELTFYIGITTVILSLSIDRQLNKVQRNLKVMLKNGNTSVTCTYICVTAVKTSSCMCISQCNTRNYWEILCMLYMNVCLCLNHFMRISYLPVNIRTKVSVLKVIHVLARCVISKAFRYNIINLINMWTGITVHDLLWLSPGACHYNALYRHKYELWGVFCEEMEI